MDDPVSALWRKAITLILLSMCWLPAGYGEDTVSHNLPESIAATLKNHGMTPQGLSLYVHEIGQAEPLLEVAADVPRQPASTIKILTTLAALEELSPAWRWKTEAYINGPILNGHLDGDIFVKGFGDPFLVIEHFWSFLRMLRAEGLTSISGDLVLDQSYFNREPGDASEFDNQPLRAYNVLPNALLVNYQAVNFRFMPQPSSNRVQIFADPLPANVEIENRVALARGACHGWASHLGMKIKQKDEKTRVIFSGSYNAACGDNELFRVVSDPASHVLGTFRTLWSELGGTFGGNVREGRIPTDARLLATRYSPPLADVIRLINKYSNNVMARQLLLTMGAEHADPPGTSKKGIQAIRSWLNRRDLNFPELVLENGAGLSRTETISARHLGELLITAWHSPYMPEFISSLPIIAMDGTLRKRFNNTSFDGRVHLKTGSLRDVRTFAGIVHDHAGRRVVAVCLYNHPRAETMAGEALQESVLQWVYQRP